MNINDFYYVATIVELGSLSKAAKKLFLTPPALSQRIKYIEQTYNIHLFDRDASGLHLTADGACFARYATRILSSNADLLAELQQRHSTKTTLRFGLPRSFDMPFFHNLFFRFCHKHPQMRFELTEASSADLKNALLSNKIDLAFCYLPLESRDLTYEIIYNDNFVVVPAAGSHLEQEIRRRGISPEAYLNPQMLTDEPFSIAPPGKLLHQYFMSVIEKEQIAPALQHTVYDVSLLFAMARAGISSVITFKSFFLSGSRDEPFYYLGGAVDSKLSLVLAWRKDSFYHDLANDFIQLLSP